MNNSKEKILIAALINPEDRIRHSKAIEMIFYGERIKGKSSYLDNDYSREIKKKVRILYSGQRYAGFFQEIYDTLVSCLCKDLVNRLQKDPDNAVKKSLRDLILSMVHNSAYRKEIDNFLWIDDNKTELTIKNDRDEDPAFEGEPDMGIKNKHLGQKQPEEEDSADDGENAGTSSDWAAAILSDYIGRIPKREYRDVLIALDIEELSAKEYAARTGRTSESVDMMHSRARTALTQAALSDILVRCKSNFVRFKGLLTSTQADVLQHFFEEGDLGNSKQQEKIASAYKALAKKAASVSRQEAKAYKKTKQ